MAARWQCGVGGVVCVSERRDAVRSVAVWCWLRVGRVLALIVLANGRCVVVGAHFVVERVEERERFDLGGIDALADNER